MQWEGFRGSRGRAMCTRFTGFEKCRSVALRLPNTFWTSFREFSDIAYECAETNQKLLRYASSICTKWASCDIFRVGSGFQLFVMSDVKHFQRSYALMPFRFASWTQCPKVVRIYVQYLQHSFDNNFPLFYLMTIFPISHTERYCPKIWWWMERIGHLQVYNWAYFWRIGLQKPGFWIQLIQY